LVKVLSGALLGNVFPRQKASPRAVAKIILSFQAPVCAAEKHLHKRFTTQPRMIGITVISQHVILCPMDFIFLQHSQKKNMVWMCFKFQHPHHADFDGIE
jgi:hypothetical protein